MYPQAGPTEGRSGAMSGSSFRKHRSRREFLAFGAATAAVVLSQACAQQAPGPGPTAAPAAAPTQAAPAVPTPTSAAEVPAVNGGRAAPPAGPARAAAAAKPAAQAATPAGVKRGGTLTVAK